MDKSTEKNAADLVGLAIETSCDETAACILRGHGEVVADQVWSQAEIHAEYGGVVPEVASRNHLAALPALVRDTVERSACQLSDLDYVAATIGPGLPAALLTGVSLAKAVAIGAGCPFVAVDHMEGHLLSPFFGESEIPPHVGLVVSGGHTLLVHVGGFGQYTILGRTLDDAAGEAFDKVAKLLGLGYPGGVEIDRLAEKGSAAAYDFPRSMLHSGDLDFSFSGLKTSVRYLLDRENVDLADACASFQEAVVDVLVAKSVTALRQSGLPLLALSGGVSSNRRLQTKIREVAERDGFHVAIARPELRTDNAAMIAFVASHLAARQRWSPWECDVVPNFATFHNSTIRDWP